MEPSTYTSITLYNIGAIIMERSASVGVSEVEEKEAECNTGGINNLTQQPACFLEYITDWSPFISSPHQTAHPTSTLLFPKTTWPVLAQSSLDTTAFSLTVRIGWTALFTSARQTTASGQGMSTVVSCSYQSVITLCIFINTTTTTTNRFTSDQLSCYF